MQLFLPPLGDERQLLGREQELLGREQELLDLQPFRRLWQTRAQVQLLSSDSHEQQVHEPEDDEEVDDDEYVDEDEEVTEDDEDEKAFFGGFFFLSFLSFSSLVPHSNA